MTGQLRQIVPVEIRSLPMTASDNPRWRIVTEDGDSLETSRDAYAAYAVSRSDVGRFVNVELNPAGYIVNYEPATSTQLDAAWTQELSVQALTRIRRILKTDYVSNAALMSAINRVARDWDYKTHEQASRRQAERVANRHFYNLPTHTH